MSRQNETEAQRANRDPITGAPGAHPVGTGVGAASGGAAGAAIGAAGGPVGAVVGATVGAVVGGLAGKAAAEQIDPTIEVTYWRENYAKRPYARPGVAFTEYEPAYRYGWESVHRYPGRTYDAIERELEQDWPKHRAGSTLDWPRASQAVRDAHTRVVETRNSGNQSQCGCP